MTTTNHLSTLGEIIWTVSRADESTISATGANVIARAILDSDFFAAHTAAAEARGAERGARAALEEAADERGELWSGPVGTAVCFDCANRVGTWLHARAAAREGGA